MIHSSRFNVDEGAGMTTFTMDDVREATGIQVAAIARQPTRELRDTPDSRGEHGLVLRYQVELSEFYTKVSDFHRQDSASVLRIISGIAGRCTEIRADLHRNGSARANKFRTSEVDPLLDALDLQFKIHSRLIAVNQMDWDMSKGGV